MDGSKLITEEKKMEKYIAKMPEHVLVLGGSGGIGSEVVRAFAANGVKNISFSYSRRQEEARLLQAELERRGIKVYSAALDRSHSGASETFLEEAVRVLGTEIDAVVDSIGISPDTSFEEQTIELWRKVFEVNYFGAFHSLRAVLQRMKEKGVTGSIVWITSTNGINSWAEYSMPYDGSKAAVWPTIRTLAEMGATHGIRVNGLAPGWIETAMNDTMPPGERERETAKIWLGRYADPAEVATVAVFLSGSGASYITGQNIMVDGGYR